MVNESLENKLSTKTVRTTYQIYLIGTITTVAAISAAYLYAAYNADFEDARTLTIGLAGGALLTNLISGLTKWRNKIQK